MTRYSCSSSCSKSGKRSLIPTGRLILSISGCNRWGNASMRGKLLCRTQVSFLVFLILRSSTLRLMGDLQLIGVQMGLHSWWAETTDQSYHLKKMSRMLTWSTEFPSVLIFHKKFHRLLLESTIYYSSQRMEVSTLLAQINLANWEFKIQWSQIVTSIL